MNPLTLIRLILLCVGVWIVAVPLSYALGLVSGRTARILVFGGLGAFFILIVIGLATGRLSFYYVIRRGPK